MNAAAPLPATPTALVIRHVLQGRREALFQPGQRVVEVGGGDGETAALLLARGVRVVRVGHLHDLAAAGSGFDGAYGALGVVASPDLAAVAAHLAPVLRGGAAVLLDLAGPWPLPRLVRRALTGVGERRRAPRIVRAGRAAAPVSLGEARRALGPAFAWTRAYALGVVLPEDAREDWVREHPQAFAALAMVERALRRWPALRQMGDRLVLEGRRVAAP